jgi:hypothetical protein
MNGPGYGSCAKLVLVAKSIFTLGIQRLSAQSERHFDFATSTRFGAKCSLALHEENTTGRNIVLDVADKQAVSPKVAMRHKFSK